MTLDQRFEIYHLQNPLIYELFKMQCLRLIREGAEVVSAKDAMYYLRQKPLPGLEKKCRINDMYISRYARKFVSDFPHLGKFFRFRKLKEERIEAPLSQTA